MKSLPIPELTDDPSTNIALDTIALGKQAIFFVNSKRSDEALAEKIAGRIKESDDVVKRDGESFRKLAEEARSAIPKPTRQCERLALVLKKGVAFHHAGLHQRQRELVEDNFRKSVIKVICATPTLAFGLDLPAFRVVVRDLKRFGRGGMEDIPVLEFEQMAGRAGRPGKEAYGEAVAIAKSEREQERIVEKFINGEPEEILSKLAVEPVMRTYVLSLIASEFMRTREALLEFFSKTFYAFHFKDMRTVGMIIDRMLAQLDEWEFIKSEGDGSGGKRGRKDDGFSSALLLSKKGKAGSIDVNLEATRIGKRVSELYIDPLSAHQIIEGLRKATGSKQRIGPFSFLFLAARCNELRPLLRIRQAEYDRILEELARRETLLLEDEPDQFGDDFEGFVHAFKTALFFEDWTAEKDEEFLLEKYDVRPGEVHVKLNSCDWLLFCAAELSRMLRFMPLHREITKLRVRVKYGVKEELLALLRLRGIGRVRARSLFSNGIKTIEDVRNAEFPRLANIIGKAVAEDVKKQVGVEKTEEEQVSLEEWKFDDGGKV